MPKYIDVDALWRDVTSNIEDCGDVLEIIERQSVVTINDPAEEIKVTNCNYNQFADDSKKVSSSWGRENDLISREDALSCFHDWIDQRGDVHTADEMPEYQRIEQLPPVQLKRTDKRTETHACDCISRQSAINALLDELMEKPERYEDGLDRHDIEAVLGTLPSAQPETCEGCKHLGKWENEVEYGYPSPCTRCKRRVEDHYER